MSRRRHVQGTLTVVDVEYVTLKTLAGEEVVIPRPQNLPGAAGAGDKVFVICVMNQRGTCVLAAVTHYRSKAEIDAEAAAKAEAEAEFRRPKDVEAAISWHRLTGEGRYEKEGRYKWYNQNLEQFLVQPHDHRCFWLEKGAERLLLDVKSALAEGEKVQVTVTIAAGEFVPGSMRRLTT